MSSVRAPGTSAATSAAFEDASVDADGLLDRDVGTDLGGELRGEQVHEAGPHEPAIAGPDQLGPRLEIRE